MNMRPTTPPMNSTGMNTATSEIVIETMVKPTSLEPMKRRLDRFLAVLDVAHDVLEHDDGVVDDETDGERQRQQRDVVDRMAEQIHAGEGADDRDRQRDRRDQRGAEAAQEEVDHDDDQHDRRGRA